MRSSTPYILLAVFATVFVPSLAFAEGGGLSAEGFQTLLTLIGVVSVAYIVSHVVSGYISKRWGFETGAEYIVVGATIGPGLGLLDTEMLVQLSPAIVLAQGSLGLYFGILFDMRRLNFRAIGVGLVVSLFTLVVVGGTPLLLAYNFAEETVFNLLPHVICVAAVAMVAARTPIRTLINFLEAKGDGVELVQQAAIVASGCAIMVFGVMFALFKPASELIPSLGWGPWQSLFFWLSIHLMIGLLLGAIFALFLSSDYEDEKILTVVMGMVIFTSGVAFYLQLSPVVVCFALGVTFTHVCPQRGHVLKMLESVERPLYISMYFFLGASLSFAAAWWSILLVVPYFILRRIGRGLGGVAARQIGLSRLPLIGRALWAPGGLSAAMALNFIAVFRPYAYADEVFVGLIVAILLSEPLAFRFTRVWLIDATDVALVREGEAV